MKFSTVLFSVAASMVAFIGTSAPVEAKNVVLSVDDFDKVVFESGKGAFVKFYAPWCGHCKKMAPDWEKLGKAFADSDQVVIGEVDCTVDKSVCSEQGVRGYPTIFSFMAGDKNPTKYASGRSFDAMKAHVEKTFGAKPKVAGPHDDL